MKEDVKYRIKEYCGLFSIQILDYEEKGILWWKKKQWNWYTTNTWGSAKLYWQPSSGIFKTLEAAQNRVNQWRKGEIYHPA